MERYIKKLNGKIKEFAIVLVVGVLLVFFSWQIFHADDKNASLEVSATETEKKVMRLLEEIEGVGSAQVIVYETEEGPKNVVVVCEGANNLRVVMNVREAVAAALGTEEKAVKIYLKKE